MTWILFMAKPACVHQVQISPRCLIHICVPCDQNKCLLALGGGAQRHWCALGSQPCPRIVGWIPGSWDCSAPVNGCGVQGWGRHGLLNSVNRDPRVSVAVISWVQALLMGCTVSPCGSTDLSVPGGTGETELAGKESAVHVRQKTSPPFMRAPSWLPSLSTAVAFLTTQVFSSSGRSFFFYAV